VKPEWRVLTVGGALLVAPVRQAGTDLWWCGDCVASTPHGAIWRWVESRGDDAIEICAPGQKTRDEDVASEVAGKMAVQVVPRTPPSDDDLLHAGEGVL